MSYATDIPQNTLPKNLTPRLCLHYITLPSCISDAFLVHRIVTLYTAIMVMAAEIDYNIIFQIFTVLAEGVKDILVMEMSPRLPFLWLALEKRYNLTFCLSRNLWWILHIIWFFFVWRISAFFTFFPFIEIQ